MNKKNKFIWVFAFIALILISAYLLNIALSSNTLDTPLAHANSNQQPPYTQPTKEYAASIDINPITTKYPTILTILESPSINEQQELLKELLLSVDDVDISELASFFANANLNNEAYQTLNLLILTHWATKSAHEALIFSQQEFQTPFKQQAIQTIITSKCNRSENRKNCVAALPSGKAIEEALLSIATKAAANNDFSDAILWANTIADIEKQNNLISQISEEWLAHAPEDAFHWAVKNTQFIELAQQAIKKIVKTDAWLAYSLVSAINEDHADNRSLMLKSIISSLIEDGDFLTVMSVLESTSQHQSIASVAREWIEVDPKSALEWSLNYEDFSVLSLRAMDEFAKKDHWAAYDLASQIPLNRQEFRVNMFTSIISERADNDDYESIMTMLEKMPSHENIELYYESFIGKWAWKDPSNAMLAVKQLPDSPQKAQFFIEAVTLWGGKEPLTALKTAQQTNSEELKVRAIGGVIEGWAEKDFNEVVGWVENQPSSPSLDQSLAAASTNLLDKEVAQQPLIDLINNITDDTIRQELQQKVENNKRSDADLEFNQ